MKIRPSRVVAILLLLGTGCTKTGPVEVPHHRGPKINIPHFIKNTSTYKGKSITLDVIIDEAIPPGKSLNDYRGRDVKMSAIGPKGEKLLLVITIPKGLAVPDVGPAEEISCTFLCTRGNLQQGNEATLIEKLK
jgi:hypothetical protein